MIKHPDFLIWALLYPLTCSLNTYILRYLIKEKYTDSQKGMAALIELFIWAFVGFLLWKH